MLSLVRVESSYTSMLKCTTCSGDVLWARPLLLMSIILVNDAELTREAGVRGKVGLSASLCTLCTRSHYHSTPCSIQYITTLKCYCTRITIGQRTMIGRCIHLYSHLIHTHIHTHTHTHTHTHKCTHTHTNAHAHARTHARTHTHARTRMHTHTHTHTYLGRPSLR